MDFHQIIDYAINDAYRSLWPAEGAAFKPEIVLCGTIFALLITRCFTWGKRIDVAFPVTLVGLMVALYCAQPWTYWGGADGRLPPPARMELFTGMLVLDAMTAFFRGVLLLFGLLLVVLTQLTRVIQRADGTDFFCLIVGALLGMCLMTSANHILMVFLAVEMASVPSYVLAGILKSNRRGSEAALKYSIYGAGTAGVMLFGISLLTGVLNTAHLPSMAYRMAELWPTFQSEEKAVLALGALMLSVGLAFKLSAVPFHFWCPDVFEGAAAEVGAFLSVASKAAALALLVRVTLGLAVIPHDAWAAADATPPPVAQTHRGLFSVADEATTAVVAVSADDLNARLAPARDFGVLLVGVLAMVTCTFGNLAAYGQTNIKRLLAYSTIAHAGYMMMAVPPALAVATTDPQLSRDAVAALALYVSVYLFMNLGAFAIVAFFRNSLGSEEIQDYAGLIRSAPVTVICFALILFSLVGMPPLAGFLGKFAIFLALVQSWQTTNSTFLLTVLIVGGLNTVLSLYYYLRVIKVMTIDRETDATCPRPLSIVTPLGASFVLAITLPILFIIVVMEPLYQWTLAAAGQLL